jgi:hypothetical protein
MNIDLIKRKFSSIVLDIPKIEPDNWDTWWEWWEKHSNPMTKIYSSHNGGPGLKTWNGVQIYGDHEKTEDYWNIETVKCQDLFPKMFENIFQIPMNILRIRAVTSTGFFPPHKDYTYPTISCRINLFNNNPTSTFLYLNFKDTKIKKPYIQELPKESNTWIYSDHNQDHATFYNKPYFKILLMVLGKWREEELNLLIEKSISKYPEYFIE